ncbi:CPBP family intramembrane glutamic endopeptidase [Kitasatospora sp. NPDC008050]|uniref:CPBP family intramembrane glutamic endopeptidase n=1 Tax=Kitasatospora sp. NPDC008050 TaxID=3364021 RepID=UPI0036E0ADC2
MFTIATWLGAGALLALQPVVHLDPQLLMLPQFGPSIGVLVVLAARRRKTRTEPYRPAPAPVVSLRVTRSVLARVGVGAGLLGAVFALCLGALPLAGRPVHLAGPGSFAHPFWLIAALQLLGACGEELGWRVFLQRHLETRLPRVLSAAVVGVLWGTWHVQYYAFGLAFVTAFLVMTVAVSVVMGELIGGAGAGALLVAGAFHWLLNLGTLTLLDCEQGSLVNMVILAGGSVLAAISVHQVAGRYRRMSR